MRWSGIATSAFCGIPFVVVLSLIRHNDILTRLKDLINRPTTLRAHSQTFRISKTLLKLILNKAAPSVKFDSKILEEFLHY